MRHRDDRGAGSVAVLFTAVVLAAALVVAVIVASCLTTLHRSRAAADLAALAAAQQYASRGLEPCATAAAVAESNGASLLSCRLTGAPQEFTVNIEVGVPLSVRLPGLPNLAKARAVAGRVAR